MLYLWRMATEVPCRRGDLFGKLDCTTCCCRRRRNSDFMPARLVALDPPADGGPSLSIVVDKPVLLVGRDAECDVQLKSSKVSRRHCCLAEVPPTAASGTAGSDGRPRPALAV